MLDGKNVLVTGGTGSFGRAFVRTLLRKHPEVTRIVVFSRDELKQSEMAEHPDFQSPRLRFFIGDVRDADRLRRSIEGADIVVHAAAMKQVPAAEYNPFEAVKTNVIGAQNVIECCLDAGVRKVVALSTDKAAAPINLYGATKLCSDKLFVAANRFKGARDLKLSVVRYGNVMGSRGSVIPLFLRKRGEGVLPITDPKMTRFNITLDEGVDLVRFALSSMWGGEIFVPKIPSYRITDVAEAIAPGCRHQITGVRPGEKLHEEMITAADSFNAVEFDTFYVLLPTQPLWDVSAYVSSRDGKPCTPGFRYQSDTNERWLSVEDIRSLIRTHVDPAFTPGNAA
jgi:UDP-N-acetylglucosamine 4,6-dehydratase (inverting)